MKDIEVVLRYEPCMMCAMAMVHSRVSRVIYSEQNPLYMGSLNDKFNIQNLKVNHKFEIFVLKKNKFIQIYSK